MKKIVIGLSLAAALTAGGTGYAQGAMHRGGDANGDGVSTRAEAQAKAEDHFTKRDGNRDGKIDAADREARRLAMFDRMDADKNGQVSRAEFIAMHTMRQGIRGARDAGVDQAMGGEGRGGHRMGGRGMRGGMMRMADANRDGAITRQEFVTASLTRFDRGDANRDGQLTSEERRASRGMMRGRMREGGGTDRPDGTAMPSSDASDD